MDSSTRRCTGSAGQFYQTLYRFGRQLLYIYVSTVSSTLLVGPTTYWTFCCWSRWISLSLYIWSWLPVSRMYTDSRSDTRIYLGAVLDTMPLPLHCLGVVRSDLMMWSQLVQVLWNTAATGLAYYSTIEDADCRRCRTGPYHNQRACLVPEVTMHALGCWAAAFLRSGPHASRWDPSSVLSSIIELLLLIKLPHLLLLGLTIRTYTGYVRVQCRSRTWTVPVG